MPLGLKVMPMAFLNKSTEAYEIHSPLSTSERTELGVCFVSSGKHFIITTPVLFLQ